MRAFQDEGHTGVLIVGDYTTRIGDPSGAPPSGRSSPTRRSTRTRRATSTRRCRSSTRRGRRCAGTASGSRSSTFADVVRLTRTVTVARLLERDDFAKRYAAQQPISVSELLYPLMQAYDSVAVEADVELGGTDQLYNLLAGREVMEAYGLEPQVVLTTPLLLSWDGDEDELVDRQQHPAHGGPGGAVRPDDADPGRDARRLVPARVGARAPRRRRPARGEARAGAVRRRAARTGRRRPARPRRISRASSARAARPRTCPRRRCRPTIRSTSRASSPTPGSRSTTSEARRLIAQGAVRIEGEPVHDLDVPRERLRRCARPGRKAPVRAVARRLTLGDALLLSLGCPQGRRECSRPRLERLRTQRIRRFIRSLEASGASRRLFFGRLAGAVFENSTA